MLITLRETVRRLLRPVTRRRTRERTIDGRAMASELSRRRAEYDAKATWPYGGG